MTITDMAYRIYSPLNIYKHNSVNFNYQIGTIKIPNSLWCCEDREVKSCLSQILVYQTTYN